MYYSLRLLDRVLKQQKHLYEALDEIAQFILFFLILFLLDLKLTTSVQDTLQKKLRECRINFCAGRQETKVNIVRKIPVLLTECCKVPNLSGNVTWLFKQYL